MCVYVLYRKKIIFHGILVVTKILLKLKEKKGR